MALAGALEIQMFAEIARLQKDMGDAKRVVTDAVGDIEKVLGAVGIGFSAHALIEKIDSVIERMAKLEDGSRKTGVSIEDLSRLEFAAGTLGKDIGSVEQAMGQLSKTMAMSGDDAAASSQALKLLGLTAKDELGNEKDLNVMYREIAVALSQYQDGAGKMAVARALMGKAGAEQIPIMARLIELGDIEATMTKEQAAQAEAYKLEVAKLGQQKDILWNAMVTGLLPTMTDFVDVLIDASKETGSLSSKAKEFAGDSAMQDWAQQTGLYVAMTIDTLTAMGRTVIAIIASVRAGMADIEVAQRAMDLLDPVKVATMLAAGEHPIDDLSAAIDREKELAASAKQAWIDVFSDGATTMQDSYRQRIEATNAFNRQMHELEVDEINDLLYWENERKKLNFNLGDEKALRAAAAAELKLYQNAMKGLEDQLGKLNQATELEKVTEQLYGTEIMDADGTIIHITGSLETLSRARADHVQQVAIMVDAEKDELATMKATAEQVKIWADAHERAAQQVRDMNYSMSEASKQYQFETGLLALDTQLIGSNLMVRSDELTLIAQVNYARDLAIAQRQVDLDLEARVRAVMASGTEDMQAEIDALNRLAVARKEALPNEIAARAGIKLQNDLAKSSADNIAQYSKRIVGEIDSDFRSGFGTLFDSTSGGWEAMLQSMEKSFKHLLADEIYDFFARPFVLSVIANIAGMAGVPSIAAAATQAASTGSGAFNIASTGSSLYNVATGRSPLSTLFSGAGGGGGGVGSMVGTAAEGGGYMTAAPVFDAAGTMLEPAVFSATATDAVAAGTTMGFSAAIPYVGAAIAAYMIASQLFGGHTTVQGSGSASIGPGGVLTTAPGELHGGFDATSVMNLASQSVQQFSNIVMQLGGKISQQFGIGVGMGGGGEFNVVPDVGGRQLYDRAGLDATGAQLEAVRAIVVGLQQAADFPDYIHKVFAALDAGTADQTTLQNAVAFAATLEQLHKSLTETRSPLQVMIDSTEELKDKLGTSGATFKEDFLAAIEEGLTPQSLADWKNLAGLIDSVNAAIGALEKDRADVLASFMTPAQQYAAAQDKINTTLDALGYSGDRTVDTYLRIVGGLDMNTESGRALWAILAPLAPAFHTLADNADGAGDSVNRVSRSLADLKKDATSVLDSFRTPAQSYAHAQQQINDALDSLGYTGARTLDVYLSTIDALSQAGDGGKELLGILLDLAPAFHTTADSEREAETQRQQYQQELHRTEGQLGVQWLQAMGRGSEALAMQRQLELESMQPELRELQRIVWLRQDEAEIMSQATGTAKSFADAMREIKLGGLDKPGQYEFLNQETMDLQRQLQAATDPTQISNLSQQLLNTTMQAFNLETPEQQAQNRQGFLDVLKHDADLAQARYDAARVAAEAASAKNAANMQKAVSDGVKEGIAAWTAAQDAIAVAQQSAANTMMAAAQAIPDEFKVDVRLTSNEVGA
jgi:hypothetical protein